MVRKSVYMFEQAQLEKKSKLAHKKLSFARHLAYGATIYGAAINEIEGYYDSGVLNDANIKKAVAESGNYEPHSVVKPMVTAPFRFEHAADVHFKNMRPTFANMNMGGESALYIYDDKQKSVHAMALLMQQTREIVDPKRRQLHQDASILASANGLMKFRDDYRGNNAAMQYARDSLDLISGHFAGRALSRSIQIDDTEYGIRLKKWAKHNAYNAV